MSSDLRIDRLTARQREVLELMAKGLTNEEIGGALGIGAATVKTHVSAILKTLEVDNRTEAAGLINLHDGALALDFDARPAIAVLRFETEGWSDAEGLIFAQGLSDDLITLLYQWRWFPVIARSSSLVFDPTAVGDAGALGRALGARYILRGTVRGTPSARSASGRSASTRRSAGSLRSRTSSPARSSAPSTPT